MKALTLWRPWDQAILHGGKMVENRSWALWPRMLGEVILLHAGKKYDEIMYEAIHNFSSFVPPTASGSPMGIVGAFVVDRVIHMEQELPDTALQSAWFFGPYGWVISRVMSFENPISCTGKQGLWTPTREVEAAALKQISTGTWRENDI